MLWHRLAGATAAVPPTLSFGAGAASATDSVSYTFSNHAIGTAAANRYVIVFVQFRSSDGASGVTCTVGGQNCSALSGAALAGGTNNFLYIFISDGVIASGSTASVVITGPSQTATACRIATYALYSSRPTPNYYDASTASANPQTISSPLAIGQVGFVAATANTTSGLSSFSVSGPITQDYSSGIIEFSAIIAATLTGSGTVTFTTVGTGSTSRAVLVTWS